MGETPYLETEALLAVMSDDEDEALRILDDMLPGERRCFMQQLNRLSLLADDTQRCPRCKKIVDPLLSVRRTGVAGEWWHRPCLDAQRAEERS